MWNLRLHINLFVTFVTILFCVFIANCNGLESNARDEITSTLQTSLECHRNPAMAVGVIKNGKILYSNGFGVTDVDTRAPVTNETLFGIASITKSFSAALLVKLLDQKTNLTLSSKVRDLLGDQFVMPDELRTRETTFEDLLAHKTAMLKYNAIRYDNLTRDNLLSRLRSLSTHGEFRVDYMYNNIMYGLVSRLAEIIGDEKEWEDLIAENLFQPLGMDKSSFASRLDFTRDDLAVGYIDREEPRKYERVTSDVSRRWAEMCGSGSIFSSAKDMTKWMNFHLSRGTNERGDQVMESALVKELHKARFKVSDIGHYKPQFPITALNSVYALGLRLGYYRGYKMISHSGSTYGYASFMTMLPTEKIGVIVLLSNRDDSYLHRNAVQYYLLDQALGLEPWINSTTICSFPRPWQTSVPKSSFRPRRNPDLKLKFDVQKYQGVYSNTAVGKLTIQYNATLDSLIASYGWGTWELLLWPASQDDREERFYGKGIGPFSPPDVKPFYFITHPSAENTVVGMRATFIEKGRPPILCKQGQIQLCEQIVAETYPKQDVTDLCQQSSSVLNKYDTFSFVMVLIISYTIHQLQM